MTSVQGSTGHVNSGAILPNSLTRNVSGAEMQQMTPAVKSEADFDELKKHNKSVEK